MIRRQPLSLVESKGVRLSDAGMKKMLPLFVPGKAGSTHNCGGCAMFIPSGQCTVVEGAISGAKGTCNYWAGGGPASADDKHKMRMTKSEAGYVEHSGKINCSTCRFVNGNLCELWDGAVGPGDCCMAWSAG